MDTKKFTIDIEAGLSILDSPNKVGVIVIGAGETEMASFHEALKAELNRGVEIVIIDDKAKRIPKPFEAEPLIIKSIPRYESPTALRRDTKPWYARFDKRKKRK